LNSFPPPFFIHWDLTNACNLRCLHCRADADEPLPGELTFEEGKKHIIDSIKKSYDSNRFLSFGGGEPLLRDDYFDLIKYASGLGFKVVTETNGTLITEKEARKLYHSGIYRVQVSMDGAKKRTHEYIRGKNTYDKSISAIKFLVDAGIQTTIRMTINKINYSELESLIKIAYDLGCFSFGFRHIIPVGRANVNLLNLDLTPIEYRDLIINTFELGRKLGFRIVSGDPLAIVARSDKLKNIFDKHGNYDVWSGCSPGVAYISISSFGEVRPCSMSTVSLGNVKNTNFKEIWDTSPFLNKLRDVTNLKGKCGLCKYNYLCGGCRVAAFHANGDFFAEDPRCWLSIKEIKDG